MWAKIVSVVSPGSGLTLVILIVDSYKCEQLS